MTHFEWPRPEWWQSVAPSRGRDVLEVMGLAYSLRAARSESVLEFLSLNFSETDLPAPALGAYPLTADEVEAFLSAAGRLGTVQAPSP